MFEDQKLSRGSQRSPFCLLLCGNSVLGHSRPEASARSLRRRHGSTPSKGSARVFVLRPSLCPVSGCLLLLAGSGDGGAVRGRLFRSGGRFWGQINFSGLGSSVVARRSTLARARLICVCVCVDDGGGRRGQRAVGSKPARAAPRTTRNSPTSPSGSRGMSSSRRKAGSRKRGRRWRSSFRFPPAARSWTLGAVHGLAQGRAEVK